MTWDEAKAAAHLLAEERVGSAVRQSQAIEDAQFARSKEALRREEAGRAR